MPDTVLKGLGADQWSYSKVICYSYLWLIAGRLKGLIPHANQQPSLFSKRKEVCYMKQTQYQMDINKLQESQYKKMIWPVAFTDEYWIQLSLVIHEVNDYYWVSTYGRIYSARYGYCLIADLNQSKYPTVVLSCKDGIHSKRFKVQEIFQRVFNSQYPLY